MTRIRSYIRIALNVTIHHDIHRLAGKRQARHLRPSNTDLTKNSFMQTDHKYNENVQRAKLGIFFLSPSQLISLRIS